MGGGGLGSSLMPVRVVAPPSATLALTWAMPGGWRGTGRGWMGGGLSMMSAAGCNKRCIQCTIIFSFECRKL